MRVENREIRNIITGLSVLGDIQEDIRLKWEVSKYLKPFMDVNEMLENEIREIINKYGTYNSETGEKEIQSDEEHIVQLMDCETDIDTAPLTLDWLDSLSANTQVLSLLESIIES